MMGMYNELYFGDNLEILRKHVPDESVDLIYLDPPFNSNATYNVLFAEKSGESSTAQITAFDDTWHWGLEAEKTYRELVRHGPVKLSQLIGAYRDFLGQNDIMAYIVMMAARLAELHRVLKPTGSIYLHCDPTASHYLKLVMDSIFDVKNFRNEIVWRRSQPKSHAVLRFSRTHDTIFFYAKSGKAHFYTQHRPHQQGYVDRFYRFVDEETGRKFQLDNLLNPNKNRPNLTYEFPPGSGIVRVWRWTRERMMKAWEEGRIVIPEGGVARYKRYLDEMKGTPLTDTWTDIEHLHGSNKEWLKYPTQKPESLLYRIISTSSDEGHVVLDPFCGCGTATVVAERLKRRWIGIDITHLAITLIKKRLHDTFGVGLSPYKVIGAPTDWTGAATLAEHNRHQFEWWALSLVQARPAQDKRKGPDSGVDGYIFFFDDNTDKAKKIVVQVKSGHVGVAQVRDLKGVMEREKAVIGVFISLKEPSRQMLAEAAAADFYVPEFMPDLKFPRIQLLTIAELLDGKTLEYPQFAPATFKKAPKQRKGPDPEEKQGNLL